LPAASYVYLCTPSEKAQVEMKFDIWKSEVLATVTMLLSSGMWHRVPSLKYIKVSKDYGVAMVRTEVYHNS